MKKIIRKLVRWAFASHVRVYQHKQFISDLEIIQSKDRVDEMLGYYKREVVRELAMKLLQDGMIEIETYQVFNPTIGREMRSKVYIIK